MFVVTRDNKWLYLVTDSLLLITTIVTTVVKLVTKAAIHSNSVVIRGN